MKEMTELKHDGYNPKTIKVDGDFFDSLMEESNFLKAKDVDNISNGIGRVAGMDIARDDGVDGFEIDTDDIEYVGVEECFKCSNVMMYDESNEEFYCPICES
jgi:hypothetical protein